MNPVSLESAIRTCKVNSGEADRMFSDRYFNSNTMVCPVFGGLDSAGRPVNINSHNTLTAGCFSANDRIKVENSQRPKYYEFVNLDAYAINGQCADGSMGANASCGVQGQKETYKMGGQFGTSVSQYVTPSCSSCSHTSSTVNKSTASAIRQQKARIARQTKERNRWFW